MLTIIFEGVDKSGKSTLMKAFNKISNFKHVCIDRAYVSHIVYSMNRKTEVENMIHFPVAMDTMNHIPGLVIVHVTAEVSCIKSRCEFHEETPFDIEADSFRFSVVIDAMKQLCPEIPILTIDTTSLSIEDSASQVLDAINELEKVL